MQSLEERKAKQKAARQAWLAKNPDYFKKYQADVKSGARTRKKRGAAQLTSEPIASPVDVPGAS